VDDEEIRRELTSKLTVPLWPTAGRALGLGKNATYEAFAKGQIPGAFKIGKNIKAATAPIRRRLGLDQVT